MAQAGSVSRGAACALLVTTMTASAAAGTFERWIGNPVGWVSNDAERATLTKNVKRFRATLPGHADAVETGQPGFEIWINIGCRASNPAEAPMAWIALPDHPEQPPAPHWLTDPIDFVFTLVRHGEFEVSPLTMRANGTEARATIIRRRVIAWTEGNRPWLSVEFESPEGAAATVLGLIARETGPDTITLSGAGTRIELHPEWNAADRALARDMRKHCSSADRDRGRLGIQKNQEPMSGRTTLETAFAS